MRDWHEGLFDWVATNELLTRKWKRSGFGGENLSSLQKKSFNIFWGHSSLGTQFIPRKLYCFYSYHSSTSYVYPSAPLNSSPPDNLIILGPY